MGEKPILHCTDCLQLSIFDWIIVLFARLQNKFSNSIFSDRCITGFIFWPSFLDRFSTVSYPLVNDFPDTNQG